MMKDFRELRQEKLRENYIQKNIFQEGDLVMSVVTGEKGVIHRSGVNYAIVITESGEMFRAWIKDIREVNDVNSINKERKKSILFTNGKTETNDRSS